MASSSQTAPGDGVWAVVGDRHVAVGRREWVQQCCAADAAAGTAHHAAPPPGSDGSSDTEVWVGWTGQGLAGRLLLSDALRPDAAGVVASLQAAGLRVLLLSGDRPAPVAAMAAAAGIAAEDAHASMRPEQKAELVRQLRAQGRRVAMVGDGVNDAPALACADVGVAMGGGTAVAGDAAGVVLLGDRLGQVDEALALGRATLAKIRQNLTWAGELRWGRGRDAAPPWCSASATLVAPEVLTGLSSLPCGAVAYNFVGVPVAAGALLPAFGIALSPSLAGGMMALSSIAVVTNSVTLRWALERSSSATAADASSGSSSVPMQQLSGSAR